MSQHRIKKNVFREAKLRKQRLRQRFETPGVTVTVVLSEGAIVGVGLDRSRLAEILTEKGITNFEMFDHEVIS